MPVRLQQALADARTRPVLAGLRLLTLLACVVLIATQWSDRLTWIFILANTVLSLVAFNHRSQARARTR